MKNLIKKLSIMALFAFIMSAPVFANFTSSDIKVKNAKNILFSNTENKNLTTFNKYLMTAPDTYALITNDPYVKSYFLVNASGDPVGAGRAATLFANAKNWTWILNSDGTDHIYDAKGVEILA